jgi:tetratricopeptide (TPR) repeat protein
LLATDGEWEQALDTAQRLLDVERDHIDALKVIAVHGFTQESHIHDAVQKLEDLENAVKDKEPNSIDTAVELAALFSNICARQPRALQISARLLERAAKNAAERAGDAKCAVLYCQLGNTLVLQGVAQYERAMKAFREATRRDPNNASALLGMILCQCYEGLMEDAESQIELLTVMHTPEDLGYEFSYLQSLLLRNRKDKKKEHLRALTVCRDMFLQHRDGGRKSGGVDVSLGVKTYLNSFQGLLMGSPDFTMLLATDFFLHMEATTSIAASLPSTNSLLQTGNALRGQLLQQEPTSAGAAGPNAGLGMTLMADAGAFGGDNFGPGSPTKGGSAATGGDGLASGVEITRAVQFGMDLLQMVCLVHSCVKCRAKQAQCSERSFRRCTNVMYCVCLQVLRQCPGMISAYVELARCYAALGMFDEAGRLLQQCLSLQPHCSPVLVAVRCY